VKGNADVEYLEYFAEGIQADTAFTVLDVVYHGFSHTSQVGTSFARQSRALAVVAHHYSYFGSVHFAVLAVKITIFFK
jgi:hypothetical protein